MSGQILPKEVVLDPTFTQSYFPSQRQFHRTLLKTAVQTIKQFSERTSNVKNSFRLVFFKLGFTPRKADQPLQVTEL